MGYSTPQYLKDEAAALLRELLEEHRENNGTIYLSNESLAFDSRVLKYRDQAELWLSRMETTEIIREFLASVDRAT